MLLLQQTFVKREQNLYDGSDNTAPTCFLEIRNRKAKRAAIGFPCVRKATQKTRAEETKHDFCPNPEKPTQNKERREEMGCLKDYFIMHSSCFNRRVKSQIKFGVTK